VSGKFIDEFRMACGPDIKAQLKIMMGHVHVYVTNACKEYFDKFRRHVYVTPKSYLSFIQVGAVSWARAGWWLALGVCMGSVRSQCRCVHKVSRPVHLAVCPLVACQRHLLLASKSRKHSWKNTA
jgi:hypothetical protein